MYTFNIVVSFPLFCLWLFLSIILTFTRPDMRPSYSNRSFSTPSLHERVSTEPAAAIILLFSSLNIRVTYFPRLFILGPKRGIFALNLRKLTQGRWKERCALWISNIFEDSGTINTPQSGHRSSEASFCGNRPPTRSCEKIVK